MKDNFDLREFLVENKMTQASNEERVHFGETLLSENVRFNIDENDEQDAFDNWYPTHEYEFDSEKEAYDYFDRCVYDAEEEAPLDENRLDPDGAIYREYVGLESKYGSKVAAKLILRDHPELKDIESIIPRFAKNNREQCWADDQKRLNATTIGQEKATRDDLRDPETGRAIVRRASDDFNYEDEKGRHMTAIRDLAEASYIDDEDDEFEDDFIGSHGTNAEIGIDSDERAEKAARKAMKGTDLDASKPEDDPEFNDNVEDDEEGDVEDTNFQDPEDIDADSQPGATKGAVDKAKWFGKVAPYVEILMDDFNKWVLGPNGRWREQSVINDLRRSADSAKEYLDDYEYPRKGVLYLTHDSKAPNRFRQEVRDMGTAQFAVHRDPVE